LEENPRVSWGEWQVRMDEQPEKFITPAEEKKRVFIFFSLIAIIVIAYLSYDKTPKEVQERRDHWVKMFDEDSKSFKNQEDTINWILSKSLNNRIGLLESINIKDEACLWEINIKLQSGAEIEGKTQFQTKISTHDIHSTKRCPKK